MPIRLGPCLLLVEIDVEVGRQLVQREKGPPMIGRSLPASHGRLPSPPPCRWRGINEPKQLAATIPLPVNEHAVQHSAVKLLEEKRRGGLLAVISQVKIVAIKAAQALNPEAFDSRSRRCQVSGSSRVWEHDDGLGFALVNPESSDRWWEGLDVSSARGSALPSKAWRA